ncbi:vacuolar protein sorting-associated protein [Colletotrichum tofieldiae]|nr:vacuolar protein sorting-associated protein [Colletotrichum tofieldiae]GKT81253.1 vacuolar protein sorting-associated protein [Colletotrichum tofieldiae]GKT83925.1 vacuolar protein sorting-associated protein [Colletotrichum tofieldiae]
MSSTDPTEHSPGLSGDTRYDSATLPVTSAEPAGSKAETEPPELDSHGKESKPTLSAKAAGKQQAMDDLIDFGNDDLESTTETKPVTYSDSKSAPELSQTASAPASEDAPEPMTSSITTLKPTSPLPAETATQYLTIESTTYVDPTPPTPRTSQPPSRTPSNATKRRPSSEASPTRSDAGYDERRYASEDEQENGSRSEIQSIMEQFTGDGGGPGVEEVMSPRLEIASPMLGSPGIQHPPRKSSLEPLVPSLSHQVQELQGLRIHSASPASILSRERAPDDQGPPVPPKDGPPATPSRSRDDRQMSTDSQMSPGLPIHRPPPPEPEPEPALPFDFHRFLEQLRNKKADPVARYLKSFLSEFGKRQWMVHEQVKIISDFLAFIANKMAQCEVWRDVSDAEFDNAREGMEKLVMNRLYTQTFSPAIPPPQPIPGAKPKRRGGERPMGPGRRGQHQEDVERDDILTQKINIYAWLREEHLDIPPAGDSGRRFLKLAQQGLLKHSKSDSSADSFMPLLIYVVLQANPEHLVSNVQYILRFRNQEKLGGEAGYYLSSLMGAIQFIENMDRTTLTITDEEFEKNVEAAVSAIAEKHRLDSPAVVQEPTFSEKTGFQQGDSSGRPSLDMMGESSTPRRSTSSNEGGRDADDQAPITGLLRSIQKPLSTIGRMFSDEPSPPPPAPSNASRPPGSSERPSPRPSMEIPPDGQQPTSRHHLSAEEAAARQASAEVAEAQRLSRAEHNNVVETLAGMFPDLDREIISDVVYQKQGRVGQAVDACLALSN